MRFFEGLFHKKEERKDDRVVIDAEWEETAAPEEFPPLAEKRHAYIDACNTYRSMYGKPPKEKIVAGARQYVEAGDSERLHPLFYDEEAKRAKEDAENRRDLFHTELFHKGIRDNDQRIILYDIELAKADYEAEKIRSAREHFNLTESSAEIFQKFIIQEQEILTREKLETWPPKEKGIIKKGLDFWMRQNRYTRLAVSTVIATGVFTVASGALTLAGAPAIALFAGQRYARGLLSAGASQAVGKGVDWLDRTGRTNPAVLKEKALNELRSVFSIENLRDVEKKYQQILEKEARQKRVNLVAKTAVMAFAGSGAIMGIHLLEGVAGGGASVTHPEQGGKAPAESGKTSAGEARDNPPEPSKTTQPEPTEPSLSDAQKFYNNLVDDPDFAKGHGWDGKTEIHEWARHKVLHPEVPPPPQETPAPQGTIGDDLETREKNARIYEEKLKNNPDDAKRLGWDGKSNLDEWAKHESRKLVGLEEIHSTSPQESTPEESAPPPAPEPEQPPAPSAKTPSGSGIETRYIGIEKRGPEGTLIDSFEKDPELAKRYGWQGETPLKEWAGRRAHQLWQDYSKESLAKPETIEELKKLGYEPNAKGYEEMMSRIKEGSVTLNTETHTMSLGGHETYGRAPLHHEVFHESTPGGTPAPEIVKPPAEAPPVEYPDGPNEPPPSPGIEYSEEGGVSEPPVEYPSRAGETSIHQEGVEITAPSLDREMEAVEIFGFNESEYDVVKDISVEDFLQAVGSPEKAWSIYEELPIDKKDSFIKQIELAEYIKGFELNERLNRISVKEFLQTVKGTESILEGTIGKEAAVISVIRFNAEQYIKIKEYSVKDFLEMIPSREEAWETYGSRRAVPEFLRKQIELAEYIKRAKPNEGLRNLRIYEFLRLRTP